MAYTWPKERRIIGTKVQRLDGPEKATGHAKYSYDINRPGMLHGRILRSPYAHARLKSIDFSVAEKMPGVKAIHRIKKDGDELSFAGDEIIGLAADTEEHAMDAIRAVKVEYDILPAVVNPAQAIAPGAPGAWPRSRAATERRSSVR